MKKTFLILVALALFVSCRHENQSWIRINQIGYKPGDIKVAVFISTKKDKIKGFNLVNSTSGKVVMTFNDPVE
ncbi:MAG TPA: cellulase N-terminal Ig-like domain-containing protein, partial [Bacteroidales bacterium]|nr:cellulase N-terminal Ig-like domain-containing protein [Bacteroidales bacterium]